MIYFVNVSTLSYDYIYSCERNSRWFHIICITVQIYYCVLTTFHLGMSIFNHTISQILIITSNNNKLLLETIVNLMLNLNIILRK